MACDETSPLIHVIEPSDKNENLCAQVVSYVCTKVKDIISKRYFWRCLVLGQCVSLLLCGTAVTSGLLSDQGVHVPTAQSFLNYVLLCLVFTVSLACRHDNRSLGYILKTSGWKYFLISLVDVEANYLVVKAYSYTTVTSIQLLDCFSIVTVLVLSIFVLGTRYQFVNGVGVLTCVLGMVSLIFTDSLTGNNKGQGKGSNRLLGDILCVCGAFLYGVSNVAEEFVVKTFDKTEFLAMLGLFGSFINGIQFAIVERKQILEVDFTSKETIACLAGFTVCQFILYSCMTIVIQYTSATTVNISLLSADFYTLLFGLFLFQYKFHPLYFVSFLVILIGVAIYDYVSVTKGLRTLLMGKLNNIDMRNPVGQGVSLNAQKGTDLRQFHPLYFVSFLVILIGVAIYACKEPATKLNKSDKEVTESLLNINLGQHLTQ